MQGIKGTQGYEIRGLVHYTAPIGQGLNKEKVEVWLGDTLNRGGDYQPYRIQVNEITALRAIALVDRQVSDRQIRSIIKYWREHHNIWEISQLVGVNEQIVGSIIHYI